MSKNKCLSIEIKRIDDLRIAEVQLRNAEVRRIDAQLATHTLYEDKLAMAEQKRLDAIRSVDVAAVSTASERAAVQAQILAKNVTESAETLRKLVDTTATNVAEQLKQISTQLADRLLIVEKAQYELKGKTAVEDPMKNEVREEIKVVKDLLLAHIAESQGTNHGRKEMYGWIVGGIMTLIAVLSFLIPYLKS